MFEQFPPNIHQRWRKEEELMQDAVSSGQFSVFSTPASKFLPAWEATNGEHWWDSCEVTEQCQESDGDNKDALKM